MLVKFLLATGSIVSGWGHTWSGNWSCSSVLEEDSLCNSSSESCEMSHCLNGVDSSLCRHGESNPTFLLVTDGGQRFVLRKKPPGKLLPGAHRVSIRELIFIHYHTVIIMYIVSPFTHVSSECAHGKTDTSCKVFQSCDALYMHIFFTCVWLQHLCSCQHVSTAFIILTEW